MSEPRRLREENPSQLERALLDAGRSFRGSPAARKRTLAVLGLAATATTTAGVAAATTLLEKVGGVKLLAISGFGIAMVAPVAFLSFSTPEPGGLPPISMPALPALPEAEVVSAPVAPYAEPAPEAVPEPEAPAAKAEVRPPSASALTAELAALDAARSLLADGDAKGSLALLDAYTRDFPRRRLNLEAEVLRIDALAKDGQREAAQRRAEAFLKRHPNSVLASRVRGYVGESAAR